MELYFGYGFADLSTQTEWKLDDYIFGACSLGNNFTAKLRLLNLEVVSHLHLVSDSISNKGLK